MLISCLPSFEEESVYWKNGHQHVIGVDEVGRGCLAGPVVAGAVVFDKNHKLNPQINDSKKVPIKKREELSSFIHKTAKKVGIGVATVEEINLLGILPATYLAMERAIYQLSHFEVLLIDGSLVPSFSTIHPGHVKTIVKGDSISYSIASASIIAKVYRDALMRKLHTVLPEYSWDENKGYGTLKHRLAVQRLGLTPHHRTLFCRNIQAK